MKKLLLGLLFTILTGSYGYSQNCDLDFFYHLHSGNGDTVIIGQSYPLSGVIVNNGPSSFNDSIDFRVFVGTTSAGFNPLYTTESFNLNINSKYFIFNGGTGIFNSNLLISEDYFQPNSYNIVIIWPTDAYRDKNNNNDFKVIRVFVKEAEKNNNGGLYSISKGNNKSSGFNLSEDKISFYPNPANDILNVNVKETERGTLKITDLSGRIIQQLELSNQSGSFIPVQLSKDGKMLSNGVYLISLESGNYREIKKFVILNK